METLVIWDAITLIMTSLWVGSWSCGCLVTWFCYQLIAKPGNNTAAPPCLIHVYDHHTQLFVIISKAENKILVSPLIVLHWKDVNQFCIKPLWCYIKALPDHLTSIYWTWVPHYTMFTWLIPIDRCFYSAQFYKKYAMQSSLYDANNIPQITHNRHIYTIFHPYGQSKGCILLTQSIIYMLPRLQLSCMQYHTVDYVRTRPNCTIFTIHYVLISSGRELHMFLILFSFTA